MILWPCFICRTNALCAHRESELVTWMVAKGADLTTAPVAAVVDIADPIVEVEYPIVRRPHKIVERKKERKLAKRLPWPEDYGRISVSTNSALSRTA